MKKLILILMLLVPFTASAKVNVVGTLPVFSSIAKEIGGDRIEVKSLARPNQDPHFLDAKPTFVVALSHADLLLQGGLELEAAWLKPILLQARNPKINPASAGHADLSRGLRVLEIPQGQVDRSMGDVHTRGNPHTWLDPENVKIMATTIESHLVKVDPEGKADYERNLAAFVQKLGGKTAAWKRELASLKNKKVVTYHKSLTYLADWTGLDIVAHIELKPGIPPSSKHIDDLLTQIPSLGAKAILMESFYPRKVPEYVAGKTGIPLIEIPVNVGEAGTRDYFHLMDVLVLKIKGAL